ncbi:hypothetical protein ONE63_004409 [Megalurothrips usitatus]|uniref:EF-hand domain-containing protein n=1 Tax=Megalurothrips usitatus TaxID=439358 RepID=A0AAV7X2Q8_9NEOP|nr:hypothetical protein ONE63_004409 [Megalurothrips usitatus]
MGDTEGEDQLSPEQISMLRKAFDSFDKEKKGCIHTDMVGSILELFGHKLSGKVLRDVINEVDVDGSGELEFDEFCILAARFLIEEDKEKIKGELREAFLLYDREGNGYITVDHLREILWELDNTITPADMDQIIDEIDADDSGTVDFEVLRKAFDSFDTEKKGCIGTDMVAPILEMFGQKVSGNALKEVIAEADADGSGELEFEEFANLAAKFMVEEDTSMMRDELRQAFLLFDREGNGYITTEQLREILWELDNTITPADMDQIIDEIDADDSGTVDFEEFMAVMCGDD